MRDLLDSSVRQLGQGLRQAKIRAVELARAALSNQQLGAYCQVHEQLTRQQARAADEAFAAKRDLGPLQGIPISVKDLYGLPGFSTYAGSRSPLPERFEQPGPIMTAALDQLAIISGKTHTVQFAFGGIGTNPHYPTPINPWDAQVHRAPGGSSAGAGVSLCEGSAVVALGTDTAGSVRIPAAWTGNVGLKTTAGRWSTNGIVPLSFTLDTAGLLTRSVEDLGTVFGIFDPYGKEPLPVAEPWQLRLGRCDELLFEHCSPGVVEAVEQALGELTGAGTKLQNLALPELQPTWELFRQGGPVSIELHHFLTCELPEWIEQLDPNVRARIGDAAQLTAHEYLNRLDTLTKLSASLHQRLAQVDALVSPTVANTAPKLADIATAADYAPQNLLSLRNTSIASYLGLCAISLPVGKDAAGIPVGLQLIGRGNSEPRLLAIAQACERLWGTGRERLGRPPRCPS